MATIICFEDLAIWQMARDFCKDISRITKYDLFSKDFRFKEQLRASSGSIMDNIAEGFERDGNKEFLQFLSIAKGSCGESQSQLYRALDYTYISSEEFAMLYEKTKKLSKDIGNFRKYLKQSDITGIKYK
ncbi:MAG: four helix bundle protein [Prevotellaceae bacterium]|jgi:four helix bundle protein|nr:four helix bundle protein [Prevotellaceae bacterium]